MFETSWKQPKVQLLNGTFPHKILLQTLLCCYGHWRGFLLPVFKHELRSLRFGTVRRERRHSKLVIAALWGFFLQRQQVREWSHRANIMQRSVLKRRIKHEKMVGVILDTNILLSLGFFSRSLHQLIILHSTYHSFMLAQLIPWGWVCTVGKHDERTNSLMPTMPARRAHAHTHAD